MVDVNVKEILLECEAFLQGHFLLSSGKHSNGYVQCAKLLQWPDRAEKVLSVVKDQVKDLGIETVIGPAMGGIVVSYELGRQLGVKSILPKEKMM